MGPEFSTHKEIKIIYDNTNRQLRRKRNSYSELLIKIDTIFLTNVWGKSFKSKSNKVSHLSTMLSISLSDRIDGYVPIVWEELDITVTTIASDCKWIISIIRIENIP